MKIDYYILTQVSKESFIFFNLITIKDDKYYTIYKGNGRLRDDFEGITKERFNSVKNNKDHVLIKIDIKQFVKYSSMRGEEILGSKKEFKNFYKKYPEALI